MRPVVAIVSMLSLFGCSRAPRTCGEGTDPVIVTGLNGYLDGTIPIVEIQSRVPETCEVLDDLWMFWDEETGTVSLGEEPTSGFVSRAGVEADDRVIYFVDSTLGVRLEYPGDEVGTDLALVWFAPTEDLAAVDCTLSADQLTCQLRSAP